MRCTGITLDGKQCSREAVGRSRRCAQHKTGKSRRSARSKSPPSKPKTGSLYKAEDGSVRLSARSYYNKFHDPLGDVCKIRPGDPQKYTLRLRPNSSPYWAKCTGACKLSCKC